jgi:hypothetical protein
VICKECEAAGYDHDKLKEKILSSPYYTGIFICGFDWFKKGRFHRDIDTWFQEGVASGFKRFVLMWPRGHLCLRLPIS